MVESTKVATLEDAMEVLYRIAAERAKNFHYTEVAKYNISFGFWDQKDAGGLMTGAKEGSMTEYLQEKLGIDSFKAIRFFSADDAKEDEDGTLTWESDISHGNFIEVGWRFDHPTVAIHKDGNKYMGKIEIGLSDYKDQYSGYTIVETMAFKDKGWKWAQLLRKDWRRQAEAYNKEKEEANEGNRQG